MAGGEAQARATGREQHASFGHGSNHPLGARGAYPQQHQNVFASRRSLPFVTITAGSHTHSYAIHPALWLSGALVAASLAICGIGSAIYVAFHDNILEVAINRPIRMEQSYEDRIAALRSEIDRVNSRQLLDQDAFEGKIAQLMTREDDLRAQEARIASLLSKANEQTIHPSGGTTLGVLPAQLGGDLVPPPTPSSVARAPSPSAQSPSQALPHPIEDTPLRSSWLFGTIQSQSSARLNDRSAPGTRIARIEQDLDRMKAAEMNAIASVTGLAETNSHKIERIVSRLGLRMAEADTPPIPKPKSVDGPRRDATLDPERGVGGPLVPILDEGEILTRAEAALSRLSQLKQGVGLLPLGQPINGPIEVTSPFGERPDPFLGVLAMHTGVDFRAGFGDPVEATAGGVVTEASRQGGYGNMVEIDHGNGIATRYGHLSQFAVVVGQKVKAGHVIGYVGSTGRSTAAHLHYETRVNGVAVNPETYIQAGNQLRTLLN